MANDDSLLRAVLIVLLAFIAIPLLMMLVMAPAMGMIGWGHMANGTAWTGGGWWIGILFMVLLPLALLLLIGYVAYRALAGDGGTGSDPALAELREAYARGELTDEEFDRRRERLEESRAANER